MKSGERDLRTIEEWLKQVRSRLAEVYNADEAGALATRLFLYRYSTNKTGILMMKSEIISKDDEVFFTDAVERLLVFEPLQYITGECDFFDLKIKVAPSVLIPRPETEELVSLAIIDARQMTIESDTDQINVLDIGTGSGCIALAIRTTLPMVKVYGVDISEDAIRLARENAALHNLKVDFRQGDVLNLISLNSLPEFDMIVSNPPYVTEEDKLAMHPNVLKYEPAEALYVSDNDPLKYYKAISAYAQDKLSETGSIWLEINESLGEETRALMERNGFNNSKILFDFRGKERFLHCKRQ